MHWDDGFIESASSMHNVQGGEQPRLLDFVGDNHS